MIKIRIKIKNEAKTFSTIEFKNDDFIISKENPALEALVTKACKESGFPQLDEVKVFADFEW